MKKNKKVLSMLLVLVILFTTYGAVFATNNNSNLTELFYLADDDDVVLYLDDYPVLKKDIIEETGQVKESVIEEIEELSKPNITTFSNSRLPSNKSEALVVKKLTAPGWSQTNNYAYLRYSSAVDLAGRLENNGFGGIGALFLGFIPKIGPVITIGSFVISGYASELATKIRKITDDFGHIEWRAIKNPYGNFYAVFKWNGYNIDLSERNGTSTEVIQSISYREGVINDLSLL